MTLAGWVQSAYPVFGTCSGIWSKLHSATNKYHSDVMVSKRFPHYCSFVSEIRWQNQPVTYGFPAQRPVMSSFGAFVVDSLPGWIVVWRWSETPWCLSDIKVQVCHTYIIQPLNCPVKGTLFVSIMAAQWQSARAIGGPHHNAGSDRSNDDN